MTQLTVALRLAQPLARACALAGRRTMRRRVAVLVLAVLGAGAGAAAAQPAASGEALPRLPAKVIDELRIEELNRQLEILRLQQELRDLRADGSSDLAAKTRQLEDMRTLLAVNAEVRDMVQNAPELDEKYRRILEVDSLPAACRCLDVAEVNWIGRGAQAGQATIRIDGQHHDVGIGRAVGNSRCTLEAANANQATLACGGNRRTLGLYNPIGS